MKSTAILSSLKITILIFMLFGCSSGNNPETVLNQFIGEELNGNYAEMYSMLSDKDKEAFSSSEFIKYKQSEEPEIDVLKQNTRFEIKNIEIHGDTALADVEYRLPDIESIMGDFLMRMFSGAEFDTSRVEQEIKDKMDDDSINYKTETEKYLLVKNQDYWKVELGLTIQKLLSEAERLMDQAEFDEAKNLYEQIINQGKPEINEESLILAENKLKEINVIKNLELYDIESRYINTFGGQQEAGIRFKIRNNSVEDLSKVQVKVYYLDSDGNKIHDKTFTPIRVTEFSFGDNDPLKTGYIFQMPENRFYTSESVPDEWDEGNVSASITDIEIMD